MVKAEVAQQANLIKAEVDASLESSVPDGYQSIGTDATPVFIQLPVELNVTTPTPVTHVHVPEQKPTKKVISSGVDKYGEPTLEITSA